MRTEIRDRQGQTLRVAKRKCIWCYAVSALKVVALDIGGDECRCVEILSFL